MAKSRTSRPQRLVEHAAPAPAKSRTGRKPAAASKSVKPPAPDPLDDFIVAAARVLALPLEPAWRPAIRANLEVTLRFAALVAELALPDEAEPAPVFTA
jgi:Protein of unknown function (DUF4089)